MLGFQQWREGVAILKIGRRDLAFNRQAQRVDGEMAFAALDLRARVEPARAAGLRALDRLAVDDHSPVGTTSRPSASRALMTRTQTICTTGRRRAMRRTGSGPW